MNKHDFDQAVPEKWLESLNERCDLDQSFEALEGWNHFHTETIRGRLRSLQLKPREAWEHFERATARSGGFDASPRNALRRFYLKVYRFENALLEESIPGGGDPGRTESCLKAVLRGDAAASGMVRQFRIFTIATYLLHKQNYGAAKNLILQVIRQNETTAGDEKTGFYLAAAAAYRGLGESAGADRQIENACLAIPTLDNTFNMGLYSAIVHAFLRLWGREREAGEWADFLMRLKIPAKTIELFCERSRRIVERSSNLHRIFLF
jgi:hypothetical protein